MGNMIKTQDYSKDTGKVDKNLLNLTVQKNVSICVRTDISLCSFIRIIRE
jgi:hypothetical protein